MLRPYLKPHRLKSIIRCDVKRSMAADVDPTSLRHKELVALVHQLRQQLVERDQEIGRLKRQVTERHTLSATDAPIPDTVPSVPQEPAPGTQEDLLAQLEKIYPEGR